MTHSQRLNALDNLRAIMMWLGIVLHTSVIYWTNASSFPYHDRRSTPIADLLFLFIHSFRMPVFFILSGFFVALLTQKYGYGGMMKHRLRRIGLPFVVFWLPIFVASVVLMMLFVHVMVDGSFGIDPKLMPKDPSRPVFNTLHLWFLYYLLWFCAATALIGRVGRGMSERFKRLLAEAWTRIGTAWWGFLVLAVPLSVIGFFHTAGLVRASGSFIPRPDEFLHNGLFFLFGWYLYQSRDKLLSHYAMHCWRYAMAGLVFFLLYLGVLSQFKDRLAYLPPAAKISLPFAYNSVSWLLGFALIGVFTRYFSTKNRVLEYVARSSYWVYLVHFPCTIGFGALLYKLDAGAPAKMTLNILLTTATCLLTYQVLVRHTPIGTLLNGRRPTVAVTHAPAEALQ